MLLRGYVYRHRRKALDREREGGGEWSGMENLSKIEDFCLLLLGNSMRSWRGGILYPTMVNRSGLAEMK